eukprot:COSAG06_NODE_3640_length_5084_cov_5.685256_1_plen_214_part_00
MYILRILRPDDRGEGTTLNSAKATQRTCGWAAPSGRAMGRTSTRDASARSWPANEHLEGKLYLGSKGPAADLAALQRRGVTHVVNCTADGIEGAVPNHHAATKESGRVIGISHHVRPSVTHSLTHSAFLCRPLCAILPAADSSCWHQLAHPLPLNYRSFTNTALARLNSPPRVCVALLRCGCLSWRSLSVSLVGWLAGWLAGCRWGHPRHLSR